MKRVSRDELPAEILAKRERLGMTQREFGEWMGLSAGQAQYTISGWERGKWLPSDEVLAKLNIRVVYEVRER
jgi:transcriptional regulator with XRE-family HTH domain